MSIQLEAAKLDGIDMTFEPLTCDNCSNEIIDGNSTLQDSAELTILCSCGNKISDNTAIQEFLILSSNMFNRLRGISNHFETNSLQTSLGLLNFVKFENPFDSISKTLVTISAEKPFGSSVIAESIFQSNESMMIVSSTSDIADIGKNINIKWLAYGLKDVNDLPTWFLLFHKATCNFIDNSFKAALFDYAAAFEAFLGMFLREQLTSKYDSQMADYLLKKVWLTKERYELLETVTCNKFDDSELFNAWRDYVLRPRNALIHGNDHELSYEELENAHRAVYYSIRWIQDSIGQPNFVKS